MPYLQPVRDRFFTCSACHKRIDSFDYHARQPLYEDMKAKSLCFECMYWDDIVNHPRPGTYVVDGCLYSITFHDSDLKGHVKKRYLLKVGTHKVFKASRCQSIGRIPEAFRKRLPDQYHFISLDTYRKIRRYDSDMCLAKGCLDRYHCFWYNAKLAEPDKPWNEIPEDYKVGSENCPSFIDKFTIYDNM